MAQYEKLADIYDYLVQGIDYDDVYKYIMEIGQRFNVQPKSIVDLACGTGNTTLPFARNGIKIYGVDLSEAMLAKARDKSNDENLEIEFIQQDMRELSLPEKVDIAFCYHDGLNYITSQSDLDKVFYGVYSMLKPGGLFIFDMNAVSKLAKGVSTETTFLDDEGMSLIWETSYEKQTDLWEIRLTGFLKRDELYEKFYEVHQEKYHSKEDITTLLNKNKFRLLAEYDAFSFTAPNSSTRRVFYVAQNYE